MTCPRCRAKLAPEKYEGVQIDRCGACGGVWLDSGELTPILTSNEVKLSGETFQSMLRDAAKSTPEKERKSVEPCPKCSTPMDPLNYAYGSGTIIDVCSAGHGIWMDRGELEKTQAHHEHWEAEHEKHHDAWLASVKAGVAADVQASDAAAQERDANRKRGGHAWEGLLWILSKKWP